MALAVVLMCSFVLPVSAASDGTENIQSSELELSVEVSDGEGNNWDIASSVTTGIWAGNPYPEFAGMRYFRIPQSELSDTVLHFVYLTEPLKLTADHEYELDFSYGTLYLGDNCMFGVTLRYYNSSGEEVKETLLYQNKLGTQEPIDVNFSFKPDVSDIDSGYTCRLEFVYLFGGEFNTTSNAYYFISDVIGFVDKDDDSGWFQKIINKIEETISNIKQIPEKINQKLTELKESITNALTELKDNLIEGLKSLFVPSDGFFEEKKAELEQFLEDHFGIIWTAPNIVISTIEKLITISPEEPSITMPAIQFEWDGELITLTEPITVHFNDYIGDGTPLETFYNFYRVFVTIVLIFFFINYCLKKYNYIFGKDGEAV